MQSKCHLWHGALADDDGDGGSACATQRERREGVYVKDAHVQTAFSQGFQVLPRDP